MSTVGGGLLVATGSPSTPTSPSPASTSSNSATSASSSSSSGSLSDSAKIAIGIIIPLVFVLIPLGVFFFCRCRRGRRRRGPKIRHEFTSPIPSDYSYKRSNSSNWSAYSGTGSEAHLMPVYKNPFESDAQLLINDAKIVDHVSPKSLQVPLFEKNAGSLSLNQAHVVEIGPGRREEGIMELADTSRFSVRQWMDNVSIKSSSKSSSKSGGKSTKYNKARTLSPIRHSGKPIEGRSWLSPPSPDLTPPERARFQQIDSFL